MTFDLLAALGKFESVNDRESKVAFFRTHVPWVAPEAYLNIVYKPAQKKVLAEVATKLCIPKPWIQFLEQTNGACLFSADLYVMGVVGEGTRLNRGDHWSLPPTNIEHSNRVAEPLDLGRYLIIASYGWDGSRVCLDRETLRVYVFHKGESKPYAVWNSAEEWVRTEVERLSTLFDEKGKLLLNEALTLPFPDGPIQ